MARLTRKTSKLFCENALQSDVGQFGSLNAGTKVETKDIDTIQNLAAWQDGWQAAGLGQNCYPTRQERNGLDYVQSYMVNYLNQEGIAEYDAGTTYYIGSVVKLINGTDVQLFKSIADNNTGNALTNTSYWEPLDFKGKSYLSYQFTSGKVDANGEPDLLDITDNTKVVFNVDNVNPLIGVLADGTEFSRDSIADLDITALADGNYNLFVGESGACIPLANTVYKQRKEPTSPSTDDVWLDISVKPFVSKKWSGSVWVTYDYVNLPQSITVASGVITEVYKSDVNFGENWQIDGEWQVFNPMQTVLDQVNIGQYTLNLANAGYLPNDGYPYEILLNMWARIPSSADYASIGIYSSILGRYFYPMELNNSLYNRDLKDEFCIPIGSDKIIGKEIQHANCSYSKFGLNMYRRLGIN